MKNKCAARLFTDTGGETAVYLLHKLSNFLHLVYLQESEIDVSGLEIVLDFGNAVYSGSETNKIISKFNLGLTECSRGLCAVLWRLYEKKKIKSIKSISADRVECCTKNLNLMNFPPVKFAIQNGYVFGVDVEGISISSV